MASGCHGTGQLRVRKEKHEAGSAGGEGRSGNKVLHLDRVEQNKNKTRMCSCLGSGSRCGGVQSPLAGHLLSLLLVPAHLGGMQLLRGTRRGWAGVLLPHPTPPSAAAGLAPSTDPALGALGVHWAGPAKGWAPWGLPGSPTPNSSSRLLAHIRMRCFRALQK